MYGCIRVASGEAMINQDYDVWTAVLFYGVAQGLVLSAALLFNRRGRRAANRLLSVILFAGALGYFPFLLIVAGVFDKAPLTLYTSVFLSGSIGALFYFYTKYLLEPEYKPHIPTIVVAAALPGLVRVTELAIRGVDSMMLVRWAAFLRGGGKIPGAIDDLAVPIALALYSFVFITLALINVRRTERMLYERFAEGARKHALWLKSASVVLILQLVFYLTVYTVELVTGSYWLKLELYCGLVHTAVIQAVGIAVFFLPEAFFKALGDLPPRQRRAQIDEASADRLIECLRRCMETEGLYKNQNLRLADLADELSIPPHTLSQLVNDRLRVNFVDFVNQYRVAEAKALLEDPDSDKYTLVAIAQHAGFNSKASFNRAFKKHTNMSPSEYRSLCRENTQTRRRAEGWGYSS